MDGRCSSVPPGGSMYQPCRDGFPMTAPCFAGRGTPVCCNEAVCGRLYPETGEPVRESETRQEGGR